MKGLWIAPGVGVALVLMVGVGSAEEAPASQKVTQTAAVPVVSGPMQPLNRIEIRVGEEIVSTADIEEPMKQIQEHLSQQFRGAELQAKLKEAREKHIERLIEGKLLLLEAREQEIEVQDAMVEEQAKKELDALRAQFPDSQEFKRQLDKEHLTEATLRQQRESMVRENILRQRLLQSKLQEFKTGAELTDEQLQDYYQRHPEEFRSPTRVQLRQIFVAHPDVGMPADVFRQKDQQAREKIQAALAEIKAGKDFGAVARKYSEHQASASRGGEIGWIEPGDTGLPEFDKAVFERLQVKEISGVLESGRGYFVVQVQERQVGGKMPFEEVRGRIRQQMMAEGSENRYRIWLETLKKKFGVVLTSSR